MACGWGGVAGELTAGLETGLVTGVVLLAPAPEDSAAAPPTTGAYGPAVCAALPATDKAGAAAPIARPANTAPTPSAPGTAAAPGIAFRVLVTLRPSSLFIGLFCEPSGMGARLS